MPNALVVWRRAGLCRLHRVILLIAGTFRAVARGTPSHKKSAALPLMPRFQPRRKLGRRRINRPADRQRAKRFI